jgi:hypothetical protein
VIAANWPLRSICPNGRRSANRRRTSVQERARRHLREGEELVGRQATNLIGLEIEGHSEQVALAGRLPENMRSMLELQKRHLRDIGARAKR